MADMTMGSRFVNDRKYTLFTAGNQFGQRVTWSSLKRKMCQKLQDMNTPNPIGAVVGIIGDVLQTGGAATGCESWQACKRHVADRCSSYGTMTILGYVSFGLIIVGSLCGLAVPILQSFEASASRKGKKKREAVQDAKFKTMVASIACFIFVLLGCIVWVGMSDSIFKSLQNTAYYPYPAAHAGCYISGMAAFILFVGMVLGVNRYYPLCPSRAPEAEPTEEASYVFENPAFQGQMPGQMGGQMLFGTQEAAPPYMGR